MLDTARYVYVRCALPTLLALARGRLGGRTRSRRVAHHHWRVDLRRGVAQWFAPLEAPLTSAGG